MKPIKEQIQWFWEQCGFTIGEYADEWVSLDYTCFDGLPPIDLNNLFKYAVPLLEKKLGYKEAYKLLIRWITGIMDGKDPADSLFELIYKALGGKNG